MIDVLEDVIGLLDYPDKVDMYDAFNYEASQLTTDKERYLANAREYTLKYGIKKKGWEGKEPKRTQSNKKDVDGVLETPKSLNIDVYSFHS